MRRWLHGIVGVITLGVTLLDTPPAALSAELWSDVADTSWFNQQHAGTEADPYLIETAEQLAGLAKLVSDGNSFEDKYVLLTRNISLAGKDWIPIGIGVSGGFDIDVEKSRCFLGTFDGGAHVVEAMAIRRNNPSPCTGLFGALPLKGTIRNVTLMGSVFNNVGPWTGGIVGWTAGTVLNCIASCDLKGSSPLNNYVGGVMGRNAGGLVRNCVTFGTARAVDSGGFPNYQIGRASCRERV